MEKEKSPAFQFYPKDFLVDENVSTMTLEEIGAYVVLLCHAWIENGIPDDPRLVAKLSRCHPPNFKRVWLTVSQLFQFRKPDSPHRLYNSRMEQEREKQAIYRQTQVTSGRVGADKRWGRHSEPTATPMAENSSPSPSPSSTKKEQPPIVPQGGQPNEPILNNQPAVQHPGQTRKRAPKRSTEQIEKTLGARFEWWKEFWRIHPCHEGKRDAMDAFEVQVKTEETWKKVKAAALRYADVIHADPKRAVKWGQGWLNAFRWEDEPQLPFDQFNGRSQPPAYKSPLLPGEDGEKLRREFDEWHKNLPPIGKKMPGVGL